MPIIYTRHAEDKLKRPDIIKFKINKKIIERILDNPIFNSKTKTGEFAAVGRLTKSHELRIVYGIIGDARKVITFHVAGKGRYK